MIKSFNPASRETHPHPCCYSLLLPTVCFVLFEILRCPPECASLVIPALFGGIQISSGNRSLIYAVSAPRLSCSSFLPSSCGGGATLLLSCLDWLELWRPVCGCVASARQLGLSEGWLRLYRHFHFFPWKDWLHPDKFFHIFIFPLQLPRFVIRLMLN